MGSHYAMDIDIGKKPQARRELATQVMYMARETPCRSNYLDVNCEYAPRRAAVPADEI